MFVPSHIASGYILGKVLILKFRPKENRYVFLVMVIIGAIIPDIDGLFSETVAGHHSIIHTPFFWLGFLALTYSIGSFGSQKNIQDLGRGFTMGAVVHLFTDWFTARTVGIKWFYPFSNQDYFLFSIQPEQGQVSVWEMIIDPYFSFYLENKFLMWSEILICVAALIMVLKKNRG